MINALQQIRAMQAYRPPLEQRAEFNGLRLDFNERLAPLPNSVVQAIKGFDPSRFILYPSYGDLQQRIATYVKVGLQNLMVTNGSDQGIEMIFRTFISPGDMVVIPSPGFAMFYQSAQIQGAEIVRPQYAADGGFPFEEVVELLKKKPKLLIICNPNNPTGTVIGREAIESFLKKAADTLVYVDEAYFEFSGVTVADLVQKYRNLVVTRTFSKAFGLAALRIGYVVSCLENVEEMLKVRGPYDVNQMAKVAAEAALEALPEFKLYCCEVMQVAKPIVEQFFEGNDIYFLPSAANFIYFKEPRENFYEEMKENGILIRPRENGFARVTIGKTEQMQKFIYIFNQLTK